MSREQIKEWKRIVRSVPRDAWIAMGDTAEVLKQDEGDHPGARIAECHNDAHASDGFLQAAYIATFDPPTMWRILRGLAELDQLATQLKDGMCATDSAQDVAEDIHEILERATRGADD